MRRRVLILAGLVLGLALLAAGVADGASDLVGNVGPGQNLAGIAGRYPLSHYSLDQHFDAVSASLTGGVDASGVPPMIAYFLATTIWQLTAFLANAVITLFTFAFSLDLLNGSPATGGAGALEPAAAAIRGMYQHTFGEPWLIIAVVLAGVWAMWRGLVQRRYTETAGSLAMSLGFCVIALAVVSQPAGTIGQVSRWTNQMSNAFLSVTTQGQVTGSERAKQDIADELHRLLILGPWAALDFGGTEHCVKTGTGSSGKDPESVPVRPLPAGARRSLDAGHTTVSGGKTCINNTVRYAPHFLRYPDHSDERDSEYDAVNHGDPAKLPNSDQNTGYQPGVADKPVTDAMEKGGQYQRLLLSLVIFAGELGVLMLLGALCVSVILAQVLVLLLACFAPVALVLGVIPGRGHDYFRGWLARLGSLLVRKAAYSLVLAVLLAVMSALQDASAGLGWLMAFGLQAALAWTVFLQRKQLTSGITGLAAGSGGGGREDSAARRIMSLYYGSRILARATRPLRNAARPTPHHTATAESEPVAAERTLEPAEDPNAEPTVAQPASGGRPSGPPSASPTATPTKVLVGSAATATRDSEHGVRSDIHEDEDEDTRPAPASTAAPAIRPRSGSAAPASPDGEDHEPQPPVRPSTPRVHDDQDGGVRAEPASPIADDEPAPGRPHDGGGSLLDELRAESPADPESDTTAPSSTPPPPAPRGDDRDPGSRS